jgi:hypothetical protein
MILTGTPETVKCMSEQLPVVEAHHHSMQCITLYCTSTIGANSDVWLGKFSPNFLQAKLSPLDSRLFGILTSQGWALQE